MSGLGISGGTAEGHKISFHSPSCIRSCSYSFVLAL